MFTHQSGKNPGFTRFVYFLFTSFQPLFTFCIPAFPCFIVKNIHFSNV
ncbi:hypothetical protein M23134_05228 [Microscilla marina ATCC 23134]|uniref:Uncharacterized protein n=1 Tax=Microscilla marina ATCC 23134 TaxID=313606 RepID=A1ZDI3_MICM2|nr:hypothetical protein M23134_05228 [Microscilla marina ATCC 23134]